MKKALTCLLFVLFLSASLFASDTIRCYLAEYNAETSIGFTNTAFSGSFGDTYVAKMGTLTVKVDHSLANTLSGNDEDSSFIRALYFRNSVSPNTATLTYMEGSVEKSFVVGLSAVLTYNGTTYSPVNIDGAENVFVQDDHEYMKHILPASFRIGTGSANALLCPQGTGPIPICTVTFFLRYKEENPNPPSSATCYIVPTGSSFDSLNSLCVCHNYDPSRFAGSIVPTANFGGDIAFFPSNYFQKPIYFGDVPVYSSPQYWISFAEHDKELSLHSIVNASSSLPITDVSILVYGGTNPPEVGKGSYSVNLSFTDMYGSLENFQALKIGSDPASYLGFSLKLGTAPITRGAQLTLANLVYGTTSSPNNTRTLFITGIGGGENIPAGTYQDTITVTISPSV